MTVEEFETAFFDREGIRVFVRANPTEEIQNPYSFERALPNEKTVKDLRTLRIESCLGPEFLYEVMDGDFEIPNGRMKLKNLRDSYK